MTSELEAMLALLFSVALLLEYRKHYSLILKALLMFFVLTQMPNAPLPMSPSDV
jgi:hypothetical protein